MTDHRSRSKTSASGAPKISAFPSRYFSPSPTSRKAAGTPMLVTPNRSDHPPRKSATGTFLLDTGAVTSMISTKLAKQLGIDLDADNKPRGLPKEQTFDLSVGGMGGEKSSTGLYFDRLELPTREGEPIAFGKAPL